MRKPDEYLACGGYVHPKIPPDSGAEVIESPKAIRHAELGKVPQVRPEIE